MCIIGATTTLNGCPHLGASRQPATHVGCQTHTVAAEWSLGWTAAAAAPTAAAAAAADAAAATSACESTSW